MSYKKGKPVAPEFTDTFTVWIKWMFGDLDAYEYAEYACNKDEVADLLKECKVAKDDRDIDDLSESQLIIKYPLICRGIAQEEWGSSWNQTKWDEVLVDARADAVEDVMIYWPTDTDSQYKFKPWDYKAYFYDNEGKKFHASR